MNRSYELLIQNQSHILISLASDIIEPHPIRNDWEVFQRPVVTSDKWPQYNYTFEGEPKPNLYDTYKTHWLNGIDMWKKYGQHALAQNDTTVLVNDVDFFFSPLIDLYHDSPPNTVVFERLWRSSRYSGYSLPAHTPHPVPDTFVTSYSNFMKIVSLWKWIDSHSNTPELLSEDNAWLLILRTTWKYNLIYTSTKWKEGPEV